MKKTPMKALWKSVGIRVALSAAVIALGTSCASTRTDTPPPNLPPGATTADELGSIANGAYVVLNSRYNEVILPGGKRWTGRVRGIRDLMLVRDNVITPATEVPEALHPTYQVLVDFQRSRIVYRFFGERSGGSYDRD